MGVSIKTIILFVIVAFFTMVGWVLLVKFEKHSLGHGWGFDSLIPAIIIATTTTTIFVSLLVALWGVVNNERQ